MAGKICTSAGIFDSMASTKLAPSYEAIMEALTKR
jgi:hypothetical protein